MSKQAVFMLVDVGHAMDQPFSQHSSRAKIALQCCKLTLQQKIFNNPSHQLGLILFGDNQSDDGNSLVLQQLDKPSLDFVRKVQQLSQANFQNTLAGGDIFSAINFTLNSMDQHCKKKKYNKRMFVFTSGMGQTSFNQEDLKTLISKIKNIEVKINIIPIDFMTTYNAYNNSLEGQMLMEFVQEQNASFLMKLKQKCQDYIQIFPASLAIELYKRFRKRDTNPVAHYRGSLQFAPGLQIQVCTYKAIRRQKLKSLARYDASVEFDPIISEKKEVTIQTNYIVQGDDSGTLIDKQNIINAFYYGPQLVPISGILQAGSKIFQDKNFKVLGFIDKNRVPRHALMSEVSIVVPSLEDLPSKKLFTAFNYSMISQQKYAIARYVPRNMKAGAAPKLMVLMPYRSADKQMFYLVELPTVEDVRQYPFNPLKKSTEAQKQIVKNLVQKMMLVKKNGDDVQQEVKVQNTFNPIRQYFYQSIFYRALNSTQQLPPLDPIIKDYINPEVKTFARATQIAKSAKKQFGLIKKINLAQKKDKKNAVIWKDLIDQLSTNSVKQQVIQQQFVKPDFKFSLQDDQGINFNPSDPITSFKKMISFNKQDLVKPALQQISKYIFNKLVFSITSEAIKNLIQCCSQMRKGCISQHQQQYWDQFYQKIMTSYPKFQVQLKNNGIGYILKDNVEVFKPKDLHRELIEDIFDQLD